MFVEDFKTEKKNNDIQKLFPLGVVNRFLLLKQKNYFALGVPNLKNKIFIFEYFPNFFRNELHTPFLPYFDTQHL